MIPGTHSSRKRRNFAVFTEQDPGFTLEVGYGFLIREGEGGVDPALVNNPNLRSSTLFKLNNLGRLCLVCIDLT